MKINQSHHVTTEGYVKRNPRRRTDSSFYEKIILDAVRQDDGMENASNQQLVAHLHKRFKSEYGYRVQQVGAMTAMTDWLQGLAINIPYMNYEIIELAKKEGSLPQNATDAQEQKILDNYWHFMANQVLKLFRKYKVE